MSHLRAGLFACSLSTVRLALVIMSDEAGFCRTGTTVVSGLLGAANVRATGTGAVYVAGLTGKASVNLSGTGSIYINSTSGVAC